MMYSLNFRYYSGRTLGGFWSHLHIQWRREFEGQSETYRITKDHVKTTAF